MHNHNLTMSICYQTYPDAYVISVDDELIVDDTEKYEIRKRYELKIYDASFNDEGEYECSFGAQDYIAYLSVTGAFVALRTCTCAITCFKQSAPD